MKILKAKITCTDTCSICVKVRVKMQETNPTSEQMTNFLEERSDKQVTSENQIASLVSVAWILTVPHSLLSGEVCFLKRILLHLNEIVYLNHVTNKSK